MNIESHAMMGSNYMPLVMGIVILVLSLFYVRVVWPAAIAVLLAKRPVEATAEVPAPWGAPTEPAIEPAYKEPKKPLFSPDLFSKPGTRKALFSIGLAIVVIIAGIGLYSFITGLDTGKDKDDDGTGDYHDLEQGSNMFAPITDHSEENTESPYQLPDFGDSVYISEMRLTLTWQDEADATVRHVNQPDSFKLRVVTPNGQIFDSPMVPNDESSGQGIVELSTGTIDPPVGWESTEEVVDPWQVVVICGDCGDHQATIGLLLFVDSGNDWELTLEYDYYFDA